MNKRVILVVFGASLYVTSLFQPVWKCSNEPLRGMDVLMIGFLDPRWFCNILVILAVRALFRPPRWRWVGLAMAFAGTSAFWGPFFCASAGGALTYGTALSTGGQLWICSLWFFALAAGLPRDRDPESI